MKQRKTELIVALDVPELEEARRMVRLLSKEVKFFKIGSRLFTACGPQAVTMVRDAGAEVFLDLKFHDIPNTVAEAGLSALGLGVFMFNVHCLGGSVMMSAVRDAVQEQAQRANARKPVMLGVTVLTSMDRQQLNSVGVIRSVKNEVVHLARLCRSSGLDGVVCSGQEIELLRRVLGDDFILVVPGVRPADSQLNDQKRIVTPGKAAALGADYIVVGRPVIAAPDPLAAVRKINAELHDDTGR
ncbi:MAG: orotidine-5'-phosphate decarboxylase [Candidatus Omnitrophica bacterium]|nr:orotidine-5'-phosphate decarboxylase [Candidatus Omnitrophota bacterium]